MKKTNSSFALALVFLALPGCRSKEAPKGEVLALPPSPAPPQLVRIQGIITLDHKRLSGGMVMFLPEKDNEGTPASGLVKAEGTFELGTVVPGDGIAPGSYKVLVTPPENGEGADKRIPSKYTDPEETPLKCTVEKEGQKVQLKLTS
jgi:hypothetical protein